MSTAPTELQKTQAQVLQLKAKAYDLTEALQGVRAEVRELLVLSGCNDTIELAKFIEKHKPKSAKK